MGGETGACQFRICFYYLADMSPLCPSVIPVSVYRSCVCLSVSTVSVCHPYAVCHLSVTTVYGCHYCVQLSPLCPSVTTVSDCRHCVCLSVATVSGCHPCVPSVTPVSVCHHCVSVTTVSICHPCVCLSPLCLSVTPMSVCYPFVHSIGEPGAREAVCPFTCTAAHSSGLCAGACEALLQIHSLQWMPLFSSVGTTTSASLRIGLPTPIPL